MQQALWQWVYRDETLKQDHARTMPAVITHCDSQAAGSQARWQQEAAHFSLCSSSRMAAW